MKSSRQSEDYIRLSRATRGYSGIVSSDTPRIIIRTWEAGQFIRRNASYYDIQPGQWHEITEMKSEIRRLADKIGPE